MCMKTTYSKGDKVRVSTHTSDFHGQVGTVTQVSRWVFGRPEDITFIVDLESGESVTCDAQDLQPLEDQKE